MEADDDKQKYFNSIMLYLWYTGHLDPHASKVMEDIIAKVKATPDTKQVWDLKKPEN